MTTIKFPGVVARIFLVFERRVAALPSERNFVFRHAFSIECSRELATRSEMLPCCVALSCRPKCPAIAGSLFSQHLVADIHPARVHAIMIMVCDDINRETVIACHSSK